MAIKIAWLTPLDNVVFFISNGVDVANMYQFGAYTECFGIEPFVLEQYQLRRLDQLRIFYRMAVRGVLAFYNGQTQAEGYLR